MSLKDVRDLVEQLKLLGYPKSFPLSLLYTPYGGLRSFKLVADILQWLAERLEPGTTLSGGTDTVSGRVELIRSATEFFVTKSGIKLNPRKLYASSAASTKELQKITGLLLSTPGQEGDEEDESYKSLLQIDLGDKIDDLRRARELSSELTNRGAALYDLLSKEVVNKEIRVSQSTRPMNMSSVEKSLKNAIASMQVKLKGAKSQLESSRVEYTALESKLQRKKAELERSKQRLDALQKIRPAYLEEFEKLEDELRGLFQQYFLYVRCRDALKAQIEARNKGSTPVQTPAAKQSDSSLTFLPDGLLYDDDDEEDVIKDDDGNIYTGDDVFIRNQEKQEERREPARVRPTTGRFKPRNGSTAGRQKVIGSMLGNPEDDDLDSSLGSGDDDSELDLGDGAYGLNSNEDISISEFTGEMPNKTAAKLDHSDEDF